MNEQNDLNMNTIKDIAEKINEFSGKFKIGQLQEIRKKIKKRSRFAIKPPKIFSQRSIKIKENYAFHAGGYNELQYNICYENDSKLFRYGIAFSLQKSASFHNPVGELAPKINKFNEFLRVNPKRYSNLFLWYFQSAKNKKERSDILKISTISEDLINIGTFIFIGKYFKKTIQELNNHDIVEILKTFDDLLELYKYVEEHTMVESKIARICWNTNSWRQPSGALGKSKDKNSFEYKFGFGYEEWLLDFSKIINGYHYGFLEPINKNHQYYIGNTFNVSLYSIDGLTKERWHIGELKNVKVISIEESETILSKYKRQRWLEEMEGQLRIVGVNPTVFRESDFSYFNVKFKVSDVLLSDEPLRIKPGDSAISLNRYTLFNTKKMFKLEKTLDGVYKFTAGHNIKKSVSSKTYSKEKASVKLRHNEMQANIYKCLCELHGKDKVGTENNTGYGTSVDVSVYMGCTHTFYELKTANSVKLCIRDALGQLMEYAYWPNKNNAEKLIIVSHNVLTEKAKGYINSLRKKFKIPLYYQRYNFETNKLEEEFPSV